MKGVVALIPAKARSRRLPGKNIKELAGLPLFMYGVRAALASAEIDHVFVSSDSPEILALASSASVGRLLRPPELCSDISTNFQVMCHHFSEWCNADQEPDILVLLQPTTPFRSARGLDSMIRRFAADPQADSAITVAPSTRLRGQLEDGYWLSERHSTTSSSRMQTHGNLQEATGHAILLRPRRTLERGSLLGDCILAEPLPADWTDIDVDTAHDWKLAQAYASSYLENIG